MKSLLPFWVVLGTIAVFPSAAKAQADVAPSCSPTFAQSLPCSIARLLALQNAIRTMRSTRALQAISDYLPRLQVAAAEDMHGDTLIAEAASRSDTTEAIRLVRDRVRMDVQLLAMLDTLNALQIKAGIGSVYPDAVHLIAQRLQEDRVLTAIIDSAARARRP
ncbi:MAG: hypothetical protein H0U66_06610 [Gemmatimonadaceae bacterium]|nr:hypothetical protein [Gemmatimonadaceae bacterium]